MNKTEFSVLCQQRDVRVSIQVSHQRSPLWSTNHENKKNRQHQQQHVNASILRPFAMCTIQKLNISSELQEKNLYTTKQTSWKKNTFSFLLFFLLFEQNKFVIHKCIIVRCFCCCWWISHFLHVFCSFSSSLLCAAWSRSFRWPAFATVSDKTIHHNNCGNTIIIIINIFIYT